MPDVPIAGTATVMALLETVSCIPETRWSTRGYSKTHAADYKSAALPLELQVPIVVDRRRASQMPSHRSDTDDARPELVVEILPPLLLFGAGLPQQSARTYKGHPARHAKQLHACFGRSAVRLARVTRTAGGNQVLPGAAAAACPRDNML